LPRELLLQLCFHFPLGNDIEIEALAIVTMALTMAASSDHQQYYKRFVNFELIQKAGV
jgi:hypothetical protein